MKKLLAVLLALVMLVSLAACAGNTDKDNPSSDAPANSDNPSMKANVNKKIAMIMQQGGLGDQGFNDTAYAGLMTCKEKYDLDVNAVECTDTTQGETLIRELCEAGYGLIINLEAGISGNMYTVARDYPDIYFVVVGRQLRINAVDGFTETPKNVIEFPLPSVAASPKRTLRKKCRSQIFSSSVPRCAETEAWQSPLMRRRHALYCARPAGRYKE